MSSSGQGQGGNDRGGRGYRGSAPGGQRTGRGGQGTGRGGLGPGGQGTGRGGQGFERGSQGNGRGGYGNSNRRGRGGELRGSQLSASAASFQPFSTTSGPSTSSVVPASQGAWTSAFLQPSSSQPSGSITAATKSNVTELEDKLVRTTEGHTFEGLHGRRTYGTVGRQTQLYTNYFEMIEELKPRVYHKYSVAFGNDNFTKAKKRQAIKQVLAHENFAGINAATDFGTIIVTTQPLNIADVGPWTLNIVAERPPGVGEVPRMAHQTNGERAHLADAQRRNTTVVRLQKDTSFNVKDLFQWAQAASHSGQYPSAEVIQLLNIILMKAPSQGGDEVVNAGQNKFFNLQTGTAYSPNAQDLGGGLRAIRGFFASVRPTIGRLLLNINAVSTVFHDSVNLIELQHLSGLEDPQFEGFIARLKVEVVYKTDNREVVMTRTRIIRGFARLPRFGDADAMTFHWNDRQPPGPVSVRQYFKELYRITLKRPDLPVVNVGTDQHPAYVPQELCRVVPGQQHKRFLTGDKTRKMIGFAARNPNENRASINSGGLEMFSIKDSSGSTASQDDTLRPWGFSVQPLMVVVPARVLPAPRILYQKGRPPSKMFPGSWNLVDSKFVKPGHFQKWGLIEVDSALRGDLGSAVNRLKNELATYGINFDHMTTPDTIRLHRPADKHREKNDKILDENFHNAHGAGVKILFIAIPTTERWLYSRIKFHGDVKYGIHTVCSVGSKLLDGAKMYFANIALKVNVKGGGTAHTIKDLLARPLDENTMLVGIDVTHPSPGSAANAPSIACVVASTDRDLFQWPGSIRCQTERKEMVEGLSDMIVERLKLFRERNNRRLPSKILIYRDGVSEGQFKLVMQTEFPQFAEAYSKVYGDVSKHPKTTLVVVGKRHHTRFFPKNNDADKFGNLNPMPGTVVDRGLAGKTMHEFWLQSHQGIKGTARPAHYTVLWDEIGFNGDQIEIFTHNMCHMFVRCTRSVSICPPAYYADQLAERGRDYLHSMLRENNVGGDATREWDGTIHENIRDSTWYM